MAKSAIYLVNNTNAEVTDGSIIPLGTIIRRYGQNVRQDGNSVSICDKQGCAGYYKVDVVATLKIKEAGAYKVILEKDGVAVIGAVAQFDPTISDLIIPLPISVIVRNSCGGTSNLSLRLDGEEAELVNVTTVVERL